MAIISNNSITASMRSGTDFGARTGEERIAISLTAESGTGAGQADLIAFDERTVASAATDAIDLTATLIDVFGDAVNFAEVTEVYVTNSAISQTANSTDLTVGGGSNAYAGIPQVTLAPGRSLRMSDYVSAAGLGAVVANTGDIINVVNGSGASATYRIVVVGRSA